jgi:hypothetical protein
MQPNESRLILLSDSVGFSSEAHALWTDHDLAFPLAVQLVDPERQENIRYRDATPGFADVTARAAIAA